MAKYTNPAFTVIAVCSLAVVMGAEPVNIVTSGTFSASDTANALAVPGGSWTLGFTVNNPPAVSNVGLDGFDAPFSNFTYSVNGSLMAASPQSIRFLGSPSDGLFTLFFGPESGMDSNGKLIPEFSFAGPQIYSGSNQDPTITPGSFGVAQSLYTDGVNYDNQVSPGTTVLVTGGSTSATPEPPSAYLCLGTMFLLVSMAFKRRCSLLR